MKMSASGPIPVDQLRELPTAELALLLLKHLSTSPDQINLNSLLRGEEQWGPIGHSPQEDRRDLLGRLCDAWTWLEARGLIGADRISTHSGFQRLTREGRELAADSAALTKLYAGERLAGNFDPVLATALHNFYYGDYETACFAAMKQVEVAVREAGAFEDGLIGTKLMRQAFKSEGGPLADQSTEESEQKAIADLFAGAIGAFKNPTSHRPVNYDDAEEASEIIQLADLLLRIVRRRSHK
jgi:uncharacterized protein (TIGR02391 family)